VDVTLLGGRRAQGVSVGICARVGRRRRTRRRSSSGAGSDRETMVGGGLWIAEVGRGSEASDWLAGWVG
jgi:hypothetical protein